MTARSAASSTVSRRRRNCPRKRCSFKAPRATLNRIQGVAAFQKGLADFVPLLKSIEVVRLTADDDTCAAVLKLDTIFGLLPFLEFFHVRDGQIVSIRAYYDPRPIVEGMSRTSAP